ncbi:hypothetical protein [Profundibacter sp.]
MITDKQIADFQRDGVVKLNGVFADWVDVMAAGVARYCCAGSGVMRVLWIGRGAHLPPFRGTGQRLRQDWFPGIWGQS